jgi:hypothetical protein
MAGKDKGDLRKRLVRGTEQARGTETEGEYGKLASELAGTVGKTVEKATELGLSVAEDALLRIAEVFSPSKATQGARVMGAAASVLTSARTTAPEMTGKIANQMTVMIVSGGFKVLGTLHQAVRNRRGPD